MTKRVKFQSKTRDSKIRSLKSTITPITKSHVGVREVRKCVQCDGIVDTDHMACIFGVSGWFKSLCGNCCKYCYPDNPFELKNVKYCAACGEETGIILDDDGSGVCGKCKRSCEICHEYFFKKTMCSLTEGCWICEECIPTVESKLDRHRGIDVFIKS